jgi:hypothetical protein
MEQSTVVAIILDERKYQEEQSANPGRPDIHDDLSMGDLLLAIQHNLNKAITRWYNDSAPYSDTSHFLRKIAALSIKAGEEFGMEPRA